MRRGNLEGGRRNSEGGKGFVAIPASFFKCSINLKPISRSEIPLHMPRQRRRRFAPPRALREKIAAGKKSYPSSPSAFPGAVEDSALLLSWLQNIMAQLTRNKITV
jgi:hypothetical protein